MGIYSDYIFPHVLEFALGRGYPMKYRSRALAEARGEVLEIGFGTGLNLSCYPREVTRLMLIDPARHLSRKVARRIAAAGFPVEMAYLDAARLPFESQQFDTVVSTWTLCTIPQVEAALVEVRRVLKPDARFLFLEHGRSADDKVARRQDRWNPLQRVVGCGCNLNRPIDRLIESAGLRVDRLERFLMPKTPRIIAEHYLGSAVVS
jgi:ubiquinone/menaquinone biosynthesis C-methylase UbiE